MHAKVGDLETGMFADSEADVCIGPSIWYQQGIGTLQPTKGILIPYGSKATAEAWLNVESKKNVVRVKVGR